MSGQNSGAAPRIAIKFGTPSSNNNLKKPSRPNPPSSLGKRSRSHAAWGGGSDSESDDDKHRGRHEKITGFGAEGAETERKKKDPRTEKKDYVIARQPNRDWKSDVNAQRRGKNLLPEEARAAKNGVSTTETGPAPDSGIQWGLTITKKEVKDEDQDTEETQRPTEDPKPKEEPSAQEPPPKRTADDEALDALLGKAPAKEEAVIHPSEEDAYLRDLTKTGDASTLADYDAMPVEEFGAALLRGMGWDGKPRGAGVKEVKRRPNRLGLGAKELKEDEDLGAWDQNGKKKNHRPRLNDYRREESKRKEGRGREDSYKMERERERERERGGYRDGGRDKERERERGSDRHRERHRDHDRDHRDRRR